MKDEVPGASREVDGHRLRHEECLERKWLWRRWPWSSAPHDGSGNGGCLSFPEIHPSAIFPLGGD